MKTFGQFSEDIEQRRQELLQKRLGQMELQKRRVAEYQEAQKEKVAAQVELQKQKTAERMEQQKRKEEERKARRKREAEARRENAAERKQNKKMQEIEFARKELPRVKRETESQVRRPVTGDTSSTGT